MHRNVLVLETEPRTRALQNSEEVVEPAVIAVDPRDGHARHRVV